MDILKKFTPQNFHITKVKDNGDLQIEAILCVTGIVDHDGDKFSNDAFDDNIAQKTDVNMLMMHQREKIIGKWTKLRMKGDNLVADGTVYSGENGFDLAKMGARLAKEGQMSGVSVGFKPTKFEFSKDEDRKFGIDFFKVDLKEASLVDQPAVPGSEITEFKSKLAEHFDDEMINRVYQIAIKQSLENILRKI